MAAEQSDDWRTQMESDMAGIAQALQLLVQCVDRRNDRILPSVSNPSPIHELRCETRPTARLIKPASPNDFSGERTKGGSFLNSCKLYLHLAPHQFEDEHAKIMWAMSYMKSGRAAHFVDRQIRAYHSIGSLPYESWADFVVEFIFDFCPKNEIQTSRTELEM